MTAALAATQAAERRAGELTELIRNCEKQIAAAIYGIEQGGSIRALLERERTRLIAERTRLNALLERISDRVENHCAAASRFATASSSLRSQASRHLAPADAATERLRHLRTNGVQLEGALEQANNRAEGIVDAMRAIARRSREYNG